MLRSRAFVLALCLAIAGDAALAPQADAGYSSGRSSVSRSSGSRSTFSRSSSSSGSRSTGSSYSSGKGSSYSSGKSSSYRSSSSNRSSSGTFGARAADAQRRTSTPTYSPQTITARDRQMSSFGSRMTAQSYATRSVRQQQFFGGYYGRPVMMYHDNYSPWFWLWLMDRPHHHASWVYHHQPTMDPARYESMVGQNADLKRRVEELERQNTPRDPNYTPPDLTDPDLMYSDKYVAAATQPALRNDLPLYRQPAAAYHESSHAVRHESGFWPILRGLFFIGLIGAGMIALVRFLGRIRGQNDSGRSRYDDYAPRSASSAPPLPVDAPVVQDNPLNLRVGQPFTVNLPDHAGLRYAVEQIVHYATRVGGEVFHYTAYWGIARETTGERRIIQLRVERLPDGDLAILALKLHDQFEYSREFYDIVANDGTGLFQITDDDTGDVQAEYYRPEGVLDAYAATIIPQNRQGESGESRQLQYWDYSRDIDTPQGTACEYLIVELESGGHFRILVGPQIEAGRVRIG